MKALSSKKIGVAFSALVEELGRDDLNEILSNWNESELSEDAAGIKSYPFRRNAPRGEGCVVKHGKGEFLNWLMSDAPFDTTTYGEGILNDDEWTGLISKAREIAKTNIGVRSE